MRKPNQAVTYILAVLLLATLTTTQILSATYARYIMATDPVGDSARVAIYEVTASGQGQAMTNPPSSDRLTDVNLDVAGDQNISGSHIPLITSLSKFYKIVNKSEVAVSYEVVVNLDKGLPKGTSVKVIDHYGNEIAPEIDGNRYTFTSDTFVFGAGLNTEHSVTLSFTTDNSKHDAVSDISGIGVTVNINASQIDN